MAHLRLRLLLALALVFLYPLPVVAVEILELNGGSISATRTVFGAAFVDITGPRLTVSAITQTVNGGFLYQNCNVLAGPCAPGTLVFVGGTRVGSDLFGTVTLDGVRHPITTSGGGPEYDGLILSVSAFVFVPEFGSIESVVLAAPFVLTGSLNRSGITCISFPFDCSGDPSARTLYDLHGEGSFHLALHRQRVSDTDFWVWDSARFDLATPEPATLLLFGTSAVGLGLARRLRRGRQHAA